MYEHNDDCNCFICAADASRIDYQSVHIPPTPRALPDPAPSRARVLALPIQGGVCDVCHCPPSSEVAMLFDANDNPTVALCVDCAATCIQVSLRVKMGGLVLQWRTQAAIKAERIARDEAAKAQRRNRKETTNASE